jgi:hypothetical protein
MAFAERVLRFSFSGAQSGDFTAAGLRAITSIEAGQGRIGVNASVKIWGLTLAQMNAYSAKIPTAVGGLVSPFNLVISAGDLNGDLAEVVNANIWESYIDLNGAPDSAFIAVMSGIYTAANPTAAQSQPGAQNAENLIKSICAGAGYTLVNNNGAHAVLRNQSTYGSALDQIERIAEAAGFAWAWSGTTFSIWPADGTVDDVIIQVGPKTDPQMVNYPQYWAQGIIVQSLFNPEVHLGRQMEVTGSTLTKANGLWQIVGVQHDLATMLSKGPWFTTAKLSAAA